MIDYLGNRPTTWLYGRWWIICLLLISFSACSDDDDYNQSQQGEDAILVLNIKTPSSSVPLPETRVVQTPDETYIKNVKVLVFSDAKGDGTYLYDYMAEGTQVESNQDQTSSFKAVLRSSSTPLKFFLVANYADAFDNYTPTAGDDIAKVKSSLVTRYTPDGILSALPMYGETSVASLAASTTNIFDITVLRALARVDVRTDLAEDSKPFSLREVYIYRATNEIQIIPDAVSTDGIIRVSEPSIPDGSAFLKQPVLKSSAQPTDSIGGIYIPESVKQSDDTNIRFSATTIVVGGIFGNDSNISYYRIDFNSGVAGAPCGQVLRNHLYTFTIKRVSATGLPTADEASINLASAMTVEVRQWEDFTTGMYFHDNYIGVSTRKVSLPYLPNYSQTVDIDASLNYVMQWADAPEAGSVSNPNTPLSNGHFTATIIRDPKESAYLSHIRIESSEYNGTDQPITATLRLIANNTSVDIAVVKESNEQAVGKTIRVLSFGTSYGSLGSFSAPVAITLPMRKILEVNFSPTSSYPTKTGGFFFLSVPISDPNYTNATTPAAIAAFKILINNFDVLILPYTNVISPEVTDMLLDEWLVEDTHRVLWVMHDNAVSNANFVARTASEGEGEWVNIDKAFEAASGYRYSNAADYAYNNAEEVKDFFDGPFGTIDNEAGKQTLRPGNAVAGACLIPNSAKQYVTPLVYSNKPGYTDYMSIGVNKKRGIIYQGESEFFDYDYGMSPAAYTGGKVTATPDPSGRYYYDVLMANIWAWVAGRVVYGAAQ